MQSHVSVLFITAREQKGGGYLEQIGTGEKINLKANTHLCGLLCGQDHARSAIGLVDHIDHAQSKFCTLNFLTTPISVAFFN